MLHVILLVGCAATIYVACEAFVNAVEWLGVRMKVGPVAVGTILAAVGTALPESVVTLVAVLFGGHSGKDLGVGAALGGPLVVGTVAYAVVGGMLLIRRRRAGALAPVSVGAPADALGHELAGMGPLDGTDVAGLARDQTWFLSIFIVKVGLGLVAFTLKPWLGIAFLVAYGVYAMREMKGTGEHASAEGLERLTFQRKRTVPTTTAVVTQTFVTLVVIFFASQVFVAQLDWAGPALGLSPIVVALLLSPIATELPEIMNAIIWVRQGKTSLALGNISGAMMIQATVPSALGLLFTPWKFDTPLILAGAATIASVVYLLAVFRRNEATPRRLLAAGGFYLAFAAALIADLNLSQ
jgi:cation:H+ antiporter